ncbi:Major facilitator transporter [Nostocoides japonicum T1-X7]|uniref:Major facilitator transporter n=1 Tax=Nostocoides japonicum T1-X7 TaxID=1194083 RepID=A0A077LUK5_9MICO|nr:Major facilitator transporter [Tetrasphaera japonica T1-X7]
MHAGCDVRATVRGSNAAAGARVAAGWGGRDWRRTFAGVFVSVACNFTAFGLVVPVIPRVVTQTLHGSAFVVGVVFATAAVVAFGLRPFGGQLAQRLGARRVMTLGTTVAVAAGVVYALPLGAVGLLAARVGIGVAEALLMTAGSVWAVSLAPSNRRGQVVGWYGLSMWGGLTAGPVLGELLYRAGSYTLVWTAAAALPAAALVVLSRLPRGELTDAPVSRRLLPRAAIRPGLALAAGGFGYACVTSFGALAMTDRGIAEGSILLSLFSAAYVSVRLLASRLPDRLGPRPMILTSALLEATGLLLIAVAPVWWMAALGALLGGGGFTLLYPALALIAIDTTPEAERGAALGAISSFLDLSIGLAGLIGGLIAGSSYAAVFGLSAALALTGIAGGRQARRSVREGSVLTGGEREEDDGQQRGPGEGEDDRVVAGPVAGVPPRVAEEVPDGGGGRREGIPGRDGVEPGGHGVG